MSTTAPITYRFCLTSLFFRRSLQVRLTPPKVSQRKNFGDCWCVTFIQARCPCHPANSVEAPKEALQNYCTKNKSNTKIHTGLCHHHHHVWFCWSTETSIAISSYRHQNLRKNLTTLSLTQTEVPVLSSNKN